MRYGGGRCEHAHAATKPIVQYAFEQYLRFSRDAYCLFRNAVDLLRLVAPSELRTALVTNGSSHLQSDKLRVLGIENAFHAVVISGEVEAAKPDPAPFVKALQQLAVEPQDAWHVGDSIATDVVGARAAGISAI